MVDHITRNTGKQNATRKKAEIELYVSRKLMLTKLLNYDNTIFTSTILLNQKQTATKFQNKIKYIPSDIFSIGNYYRSHKNGLTTIAYLGVNNATER